ncbi:hypothetical protein CFP56_020698 [Quercus suber]|uniref:DUF7722 domain-containing protein n=1 Tax=Quercus suber TaxID=58331 RepID=A0AAW0KG50_QUESU
MVACSATTYQQAQLKEAQSKDLKEEGIAQIIVSKEDSANGFEMPLHYPRYTKEDYEKMEDWKLDMVLKEYGLTVKGALDAKDHLSLEHLFGQISFSYLSFNNDIRI